MFFLFRAHKLLCLIKSYKQRIRDTCLDNGNNCLLKTRSADTAVNYSWQFHDSAVNTFLKNACVSISSGLLIRCMFMCLVGVFCPIEYMDSFFFFTLHRSLLSRDFHSVIWNDICILITPIMLPVSFSPSNSHLREKEQYISQLLLFSPKKLCEFERGIFVPLKDAWFVCVAYPRWFSLW